MLSFIIRKFGIRISILLFAIVLLNIPATAQKQGRERIDSLKTALVKKQSSNKTDTSLINLLIDISYEYYSIDPDSGIYFGKEALVASELSHWEKGMAMAGNRIGLSLWAKSDYPQSIEYHFRALKMAEKIDYKPGIALILGNIGLSYEGQRDYEKALDYHNRAMQLNKMLGDQSGEARNLGNIGVVYDAKGDFPNAIDYYFQALNLYKSLGDKKGVARNLGNIGFAYQLQNRHTEALDYHFRALKMNSELGNRIQIGINLGNIGSEYLSILQDTSVQRRKQLPDSLKNERIAMKSEKYLNESIAIFEEIKDFNGLQELYMYLSNLQELTGNYKAGLASYKRHADYKNTLFNEENDRKISQLEKTREDDIKQKEIELLKSQNEIERLNAERRSTINYGLGIAFIILGAGTINIFRQSKKRKQINNELQIAYSQLKDTQQQLVQSEKMAAFGVMASRIAHEIQNPLNFVNNFSEVSAELIQEMNDSNDENERINSGIILKQNMEKILFHGQRAEGIVRELQMHINTGTAHEYFE